MSDSWRRRRHSAGLWLMILLVVADILVVLTLLGSVAATEHAARGLDRWTQDSCVRTVADAGGLPQDAVWWEAAAPRYVSGDEIEFAVRDEEGAGRGLVRCRLRGLDPDADVDDVEVLSARVLAAEDVS